MGYGIESSDEILYYLGVNDNLQVYFLPSSQITPNPLILAVSIRDAFWEASNYRGGYNLWNQSELILNNNFITESLCIHEKCTETLSVCIAIYKFNILLHSLNTLSEVQLHTKKMPSIVALNKP